MIAAIASTTPSASRRSRIRGGENANAAGAARQREHAALLQAAQQQRRVEARLDCRPSRRSHAPLGSRRAAVRAAGPAAAPTRAPRAPAASGRARCGSWRSRRRRRAVGTPRRGRAAGRRARRDTDGPTAVTPNGSPLASDEPRQTMSGPTPWAADASVGPMRSAVRTSSTTRSAPTLRQSSATDARYPPAGTRIAGVDLDGLDQHSGDACVELRAQRLEVVDTGRE